MSLREKIFITLESQASQRLPCKPTTAKLFGLLIEKKDVALSQFAPIIEKDMVLSLKVMARANEVMKRQSRQSTQAIRNVGHGVSILGLGAIEALCKETTTCDVTSHNISNQNYLKLLSQIDLLSEILTDLLQDAGHLNEDDGRFLGYGLFLPKLCIAQEYPEVWNRLAHVSSVYPIEFWQLEGILLSEYCQDMSPSIMKHWNFPEHLIQLVETAPRLKQLIKLDMSLDVKAVQGVFRKYKKSAQVVLPILVCCFFLVSRSPLLWDDKTTRFLIHWLARFLFKTVDEVRYIFQYNFLKAAHQHISLSAYGKGLMNHWPYQAAMSIELIQTILKRIEAKDFDIKPTLMDMTSAKKQDTNVLTPKVQTLETAKIQRSNLPKPSPAIVSNPTQAKSVQPKQIVRNEVGDCVSIFIQTLKSNPNAYGGNLPTCASMIETLRVGLESGPSIVLLQMNPQVLSVASVSGLPSQHIIRQLRLKPEEYGVFKNFLEKPVSLWMKDTNRQQIGPVLPKSIRQLVGEEEALFNSLLDQHKKPIGVVVSISKDSTKRFDQTHYKAFQSLVLSVRLKR